MVDADAVRDYLDSALSGESFFIDNVIAQKAGKRTLLTIALDSFSPLTLDEIARASRIVDGILEDSDVVGAQPYTLEVTSRGVEAGLIKPHHFIQSISRLVKITTLTGEELTVRIQDANQDALTTDDDDVIEYRDIRSAMVQIEFNRKSEDED